MRKTCSKEGCNYPVWARGFCKYHDTGKPKKIKQVSDTQLKRLAEYRKVRNEFMKENPNCAVCGNPSTDVHHLRGKIGNLLTNTKNFLSVCRRCHTYIEEHPAWAKEKGYSKNRL